MIAPSKPPLAVARLVLRGVRPSDGLGRPGTAAPRGGKCNPERDSVCAAADGGRGAGSRADGAKARIQVRDYGPGVPEEALAHIFDPFYRVEGDRNRDRGGVGLGLAIARRAVELHKGKLLARNAHPGLLVEMDLPL